ncbi:MAG: ABC transporter ATP-binding protein [Candidatus Sericytochromatia bacterium]|nr:ABC transporter ATP-binding protein [Candidatus Sericytochromatia bacterium]
MGGIHPRIAKLWALLEPAQRRGAFVLLALMAVGMGLEMLGVGLVIPALTVLSQPDVLARYPGVVAWLPARLTGDGPALILAVMGALLGLFALKNVFLSYMYLRQARFVYLLVRDLATRLFGLYVGQPYAFHLQRNAASMLQVVRGDMALVGLALQHALSLGVELLVLVGVGLVLLAVEPAGALAVFAIIGLSGWGFLAATRQRMAFWGGHRQRHDEAAYRVLIEGLGAIKELRVLGREGLGVGRLDHHASASAQAGIRLSFYPQLPRLGLELMAVAALVGLVLLLVVEQRPFEAILPTVGLFAAGAFRVMPSVNRMLTAAQGLQGSVAAIDKVHAEVTGLAPVPVSLAGPGPAPLAGAIVVEGLGFRYPGAPRATLVDVSLTIPCGASVGFIGASGAGKSTLVDLLLGLLTPDAGAIRVDGRDIREDLRAWQAQLGYVPQAISLVDDTLRRNVALGLPDDAIDDAAVWRALRAAQLEAFVRELPEGLEAVVGERGVRLSGGQRQRIGIARALYHDPPVLVLDEATSALDTATEAGVMEAVRALQGTKTVLIIAHRLSTVAHCDTVHRLEQGRLVASGPLDQVGS